MHRGDWLISAPYLKGISRALGQREVVLPQETLSALRQPMREPWWPGQVVSELWVSLGRDEARRVATRASFDTMGPLVRPLAGVVLTLSKSPLEALLKRLPVFVGAGVQGVTTVVEPAPRRARVTFTFPCPVPGEVSAAWYGMFAVGFQLAKTGAVEAETIEPTRHGFTLVW